MRLHRIKTQNFMSMRDCCIENLNHHLNFFVGPNGSGKSTTFLALEIIREAFKTQGKDSLNMREVCTQGVNPQELDVTLTVEFDMPWERELITAFLCASFSYPDFLRQASELGQRIGMSDEIIAAFSAWLLEVFTLESVAFLFQGDLRLTYRSGVHEYLRLSYTFMCANEPITITAGMPAAFVDGGIWKGSPPESHLTAPPGEYLLAAFLGRRDQLDTITGYLTGQLPKGPESIDAAGLFLSLAESHGWLIARKVPSRFAHVPAYKRLSDLSGEPMYQTYMPLPTNPAEVFTFSHLIYFLLRRALIFSTDLQMTIPTSIGLTEQSLTRGNILTNAEQQVALRLFHLKNGDGNQREQFKRIQQSFRTMTGQQFDLVAKTEIENTGNQDTQHHILTIEPRIIDSHGDVSLRYHGAGIKEALRLATLLDESEGCVVLLDEPTANLHAGMQHKLLEVLREAPSQVIVVTHSAHVLPTRADEFLTVRRLQKQGFETQIFSLGNVFAGQPAKLENELRSSSNVVELLFANGVLLVEGATEVGAFNEWFLQSAASKGRTFADFNLVLHPVDGKNEFPFYLRFLTAFGVPWTVICDGDALSTNQDRNNLLLWKSLKELHLIPDVPDKAASFETLTMQAKEADIYTYDAVSPIKFETIPEVKAFLDTQWAPSGKTTYRGRYIAQHVPCPHMIDETLQQCVSSLSPIFAK